MDGSAVGCGQTGLQVAARFKQMDIPTVTIERHSRVGDGWRKRYPSLTLHTVKEHHARTLALPRLISIRVLLIY